MIIDLANVGPVAKPIDVSLDADSVDLEGEEIRLDSPVAFRGEAVRVEGLAHVRGEIETDAVFSCTRCLEPISRHLVLPFDDILVDATEEDTRTEIEIEADKLDESLVAGGQVDIAEIVREQLLLAEPEQVFCKDDCKGLCPKCGANLNLIDCKCADDEIDPRWAALRNLK